MPYSIEARDLTRTYSFGRSFGHLRNDQQVVALDRISFQAGAAEITGFLGPNGAGKTTLVKVIATILTPTSGSVSVLGYDVTKDARSIARRTGIVIGGERGFYEKLTAEQNLRYWAAVYGVPRRIRSARVHETLDRVGLGGHRRTGFERMSRGMKQRLHLARGLINDPELIILDEPTSGLDPVAAHEYRALLAGLRDESRTVILTTHDMAEAEALCDRVALIDHGKILAFEHPRRLGSLFASFEQVDAQGVRPELVGEIGARDGVGQIERMDDGWIKIPTTAPGAAQAVLKLLVDDGVTALRTCQPSLEEIYLHVIGQRGLRV